MHKGTANSKSAKVLMILAAIACAGGLRAPWATAAAEEAAMSAGAPRPESGPALQYRCDSPAALFWVASALSGDPLMDRHHWQLWWTGHPGATAAARDREARAIEVFGRLRATYRGRFLETAARSNGWVPLPPPSAHRLDVRFASLFLGARDGEDLMRRAEVLLTDADWADLREIATVWLPKLAATAANEGDVCGFAKSFGAHAQQSGISEFLGKVAVLFEAAGAGTVTVQFVPAPDGQALRGRRIGNYLVVEARPDQRPQHRSDVVVHEACHWLQERGGMDDDPRLINALFGSADRRAAQAWELLAEGTATALGQGLWVSALAERSPNQTSPAQRRWYEDDQIDPYAKALAPALQHALHKGLPLRSLVEQILAAVPPPDSGVATKLHRYVLLSDHRDSPWLAKAWFSQVPPRAVWRADLDQAQPWASGAKGTSLVVVATWAELKRVPLGGLGIAPPPPALRRQEAVFSGDRAGGARLLLVVAPTIAQLGDAVARVPAGPWPPAGWTLSAQLTGAR